MAHHIESNVSRDHLRSRCSSSAIPLSGDEDMTPQRSKTRDCLQCNRESDLPGNRHRLLVCQLSREHHLSTPRRSPAGSFRLHASYHSFLNSLNILCTSTFVRYNKTQVAYILNTYFIAKPIQAQYDREFLSHHELSQKKIEDLF